MQKKNIRQPESGQENPMPVLIMSDLAALPIWVAWKEEWKDSRWTKPPRNAGTGGNAQNNNSKTWRTRKVAERRAGSFDTKRMRGVGVMLSDLKDFPGWQICGLDLDGCRNPETGECADWAEQVVERFDSYSEVSPSETGIRGLFLARKEDLDALRKADLIRLQADGKPGAGRNFALPGDHKEIALFIERKFLTITDWVLADQKQIKPVDLKTLKWLLVEHGPSVQSDNGSPGKDTSGSGEAWRFMEQQARMGRSEDQAREAIEVDNGAAGEWWSRVDTRQQDRTVERAFDKVQGERDGHDALLDENMTDEGLVAIADEALDPETIAAIEELVGPIKKRSRTIVETMNDRYALTFVGSSAVVFDFAREGVALRTTAAFREMHGNRKVDSKKLGHYWLDHLQRRTYDKGLVFDPSGRAPEGMLNLWQGFATNPDPTANCELIVNYVREVVAGGSPVYADYIFTWLADIVRNPSEKPGVALVLRGLKGVGKDTLAEIMRQIIGKHHTAHITNSARIGSQFNAQFETALLVHIEEASWGGDRDAKGVLQSLITSPHMALERKGVDVVQIDSYVRLLFTSNEDWVIPATADERRYAVFDVPDHRKDDEPYWADLYAQIKGSGTAGFLAFLNTWEPPEGVEVRKPPQTKGLARQKLAGLKNAGRWWYDLLAEGVLPHSGGDKFDGNGWVTCSRTIAKDNLRNLYSDFMQNRRHQGEPLSSAEFGKELKLLCSGVREKRPTVDGERIQSYKLPPLPDCREQFAHAQRIAPEDINWEESMASPEEDDDELI